MGAEMAFPLFNLGKVNYYTFHFHTVQSVTIHKVIAQVFQIKGGKKTKTYSEKS